ncbi:MAG: hypothetical protein ACI4EI_07950 [Muricoprocola sp.]
MNLPDKCCDTHGLFRATHSHISAPLRSVLNGCPPDIQHPARHSHIVRGSSHFYAHVGAGSKAVRPLVSKLTWAQTLEPWYHHLIP